MNIIRMSGGLGNQMFQYALFLKYTDMGIKTKIDDFTEYAGRDNARPINLGAFNIEYPRCTNEELYAMRDSYPDIFHKIKRKIVGRNNRTYEEASSNFDPQILNCRNNYVAGCFQSEKYFNDIKDKILSAYTFSKIVREEADGIYKISPDEIYTGIHIRRGDYVKFSDEYGGICTDEYYDKAINYILQKEKNTRFLVFCNDTKWAFDWIEKYQAKGINIDVISGTTEETGYIDMYLMSKCNHNIIANSSFSWWGAYLNQNPDKLVIAPSKWVNHINQQDIFTEDMIKI